ncbi:LLM class flavin-dependent oxidoreductase [Saccharopolyspora gloriosae]|uniref:Luciferase family oxidoreductase group 1 n=1 Tax=Saccharopolyspora gloriosae TaxID=455344 RepID=A0A840NFX6_9PSEU|nr:luciferase family oxidoreductase group 1 [Saccharopolyspora gloriosae]
MTAPLRFSVLDRSLVRRGRAPAESLSRTVRFAVEAEALGYHRFWVAEHHGVPGVAGAAPAVLAAAVAGATSRIRVGTGGVMLPNHAPLVVAEQFGVLESLHPGRIDLGLGRSLGFTSAVRRALGHGRESAERFAEQLAELLGYFTGGPESAVRAVPSEGLHIPVFVLATGAGVEFAAVAGLPLVIAAVRGDDALRSSIDAYRERFRPSAWSDRPHVVLSRSVAVAETTEQARRILVPEAWSTAYSRVHGVFPPLEPAAEILARGPSDKEREHFERAMRGHVYGTEEQVGDRLQSIVDAVEADELLITTSGHDEDALLDSYRRLARLIPAVR